MILELERSARYYHDHYLAHQSAANPRRRPRYYPGFRLTLVHIGEWIAKATTVGSARPRNGSRLQAGVPVNQRNHWSRQPNILTLRLDAAACLEDHGKDNGDEPDALQ